MVDVDDDLLKRLLALSQKWRMSLRKLVNLCIRDGIKKVEERFK